MKAAYFSYILALLLFGSNGIIAKGIALSSMEIVLYRTFIGSLFLLFLFFVTGNKWTFYKYKKHFCYLVLSGMAMGFSWMFLYEAYQQIGVSVSSLLYYCGPVIVMMLAPVIFKEKLTVHKVMGFVIVFVGIFLVNGNMTGAQRNVFGFVCGMLSAVMYSIMVICNKKASKIAGLENSMLQLVISCVTVAVMAFIKGDYEYSISKESLLPLLVLGIVNTGIGCYLYFSKLEKLPIQSVSVLGYLEPLSAVVMSVMILQEKMSGVQVVGAVLVLGGAVFAEMEGNGKVKRDVAFL